MNQTIGIDLGGTNIRGGLIEDGKIIRIISQRINATGTADEVLQQFFSLTDELVTEKVSRIGIGVPGLVDAEKGIVYDVVYIPAWVEVRLAEKIEERYHLPAFINNDANCFALAEFYYGKGRGCNSMVGLSIGTGLGAGVIINKQLYSGSTGGAGEFGMCDYLDKSYEYYACGQFFNNVYGVDGEEVFRLASGGDRTAIGMYAEMGFHLGNAIKMILYALDVGLIVFGGSVSKAYSFFQEAMWKQINTFGFHRARRQLRIEISDLEHPGILGAGGPGI
jgi:glucokinase